MSKNLAALDNFKTSHLSKQNNPLNASNDAIKKASITLFHEDPKNSRLVIDDEKLQELAATMTELDPQGNMRGILEPISVRKHPDIEGAFMINGGHRRVRAAKLAGLTEIPYYIRDNFSAIDNYLLNMYEALSTEEQALFIIEQVTQEGMTASELAKAIGKPNSFISDHLAFGELSPYVTKLYEDGLCKSVQALAALHRADKKFPEQVQAFCAEAQNRISVGEAKAFAKQLKDNAGNKGIDTVVTEATESTVLEPKEKEQEENSSTVSRTKKSNTASKLKGRVSVEHQGLLGYIMTDKPATKAGYVWVDFTDDEMKQALITEVLAAELVVQGVI